MGAPIGANPPPGLYFANSANYGIGNDVAAGHTQAIGIEVPAFIWSSGYNFLGASYAASVAAVLVESGISGADYERGVFNTIVNPVSLSWDLGHGLFVSFQEVIYTPMKSDVALSSSSRVVSGAAFEQRVSISYLANDWVISANNIFALTTNDAGGQRAPDYYNIDATVAHKFGAWEFGAVGYGSFDLETTAYNFAPGRGRAVGVGGLLGYGFSNGIGLTLQATHQVLTRGDTNYAKDDTRVWTSLVIPIWSPTAPAPKPVIAKY
jgi:hypothetical protein